MIPNKAILLSVCIVAMTIATSYAFARNIFGEDNRKIIVNSTAPYTMIGRLLIEPGSGQNSFCTGSLIGPDLVLTNAHCAVKVVESNGRGQITFFAGYSRGSWLEKSKVQNVIGGFQRNAIGVIFDQNNDWAILTLREPIGKKLGWFTIAPSTDVPKTLWESVKEYVGLSVPPNYSVTLAGYSGDREDGQVLSVHENCDITKIEASVVRHNCDMTPGASGSPMFRKLPDGRFEIVTLNSAQLEPISPNPQLAPIVLPSYSHRFANLAQNTKLFYNRARQSLRESLERNREK